MKILFKKNCTSVASFDKTDKNDKEKIHEANI